MHSILFIFSNKLNGLLIYQLAFRVFLFNTMITFLHEIYYSIKEQIHLIKMVKKSLIFFRVKNK